MSDAIGQVEKTQGIQHRTPTYSLPSQPVYLYHIVDRRGRVRYVGLSVTGEKRLSGHIREAKAQNGFVPRPFIAWLRKELAAGRVPKIRVIRECKTDPIAIERKEIVKMRRKGHPLLNVVVRGDNYRSRERWECPCGRVFAGRSCPHCGTLTPDQLN